MAIDITAPHLVAFPSNHRRCDVDSSQKRALTSNPSMIDDPPPAFGPQMNCLISIPRFSVYDLN
jgi:hypothetical protein